MSSKTPRRYDIAAAARKGGKRSKGVTKLPVIMPRGTFTRAYTRACRTLLKKLSVAANETVVARYRSKITVDADEDAFEEFRRAAEGFRRATDEEIRRLIELEASRHTDEFRESARRAFGVDLEGVISTENLKEYLDSVTLQNAGLIKGLTDDVVKRIQITVTGALIEGRTVKELRESLKADFDFGDKRAQLIARDQTGKINGKLTKIRHEEAGVDEYEWFTSRDERVRSRHAKLHGKRYKYGEATGAEQGLEPGQPVQCRCIAIGVVEI